MPPVEIKETSRLWCYRNSPDVCGWCGESKQVNTGCCVWSKSGCERLVFLVFQWCDCSGNFLNGTAILKIPSRVRLHLAPPEVASPQGYRCTCACFPMVQLHLAPLEEMVLLLLKGVAAPVLACQWFPSRQEWCSCSKRKALWCGCLLMLRKNHPFSSFLNFLSLV